MHVLNILIKRNNLSLARRAARWNRLLTDFLKMRILEATIWWKKTKSQLVTLIFLKKEMSTVSRHVVAGHYLPAIADS